MNNFDECSFGYLHRLNAIDIEAGIYSIVLLINLQYSEVLIIAQLGDRSNGTRL